MIRMLRSLALLCGLIAAGPGWSQAPQAPLELVKSTADEVLGKLRQDRALLQQDPGRIYDLVNQYILPHFDFERMSQWVLGRYWRQVTPEQRERFIKEFRTLLVRTYASSLLEYVDQKITYAPLRAAPDATEVVVRSEVEQPGGFPIPVTYSLYKPNGAWKVYDVTIDNVSLVANYRTSFANEIRQGGIDQLIDKLAKRNQQSNTKQAG